MIRHRWSRFGPLSLLVLGVLLLAMSSATALAAPQGTLSVGLAADPESMDPYFVYHPSGFAVMEAMYDSLVIADWDGDIVPHLAESWNVVDDTTVEFTLRSDVTFHNG